MRDRLIYIEMKSEESSDLHIVKIKSSALVHKNKKRRK